MSQTERQARFARSSPGRCPASRDGPRSRTRPTRGRPTPGARPPALPVPRKACESRRRRSARRPCREKADDRHVPGAGDGRGQGGRRRSPRDEGSLSWSDRLSQLSAGVSNPGADRAGNPVPGARAFHRTPARFRVPTSRSSPCASSPSWRRRPPSRCRCPQPSPPRTCPRASSLSWSLPLPPNSRSRCARSRSAPRSVAALR